MVSWRRERRPAALLWAAARKSRFRDIQDVADHGFPSLKGLDYVCARIEVFSGRVDARRPAPCARRTGLRWRRANAPIVVTTADNDGPGSLRWAITQANMTPGPDRIVFQIPKNQLQPIRISSQLPAITDTVVIDGSSQPGIGGRFMPIVEIDGRWVARRNGRPDHHLERLDRPISSSSRGSAVPASTSPTLPATIRSSTAGSG